jgi:uncharacterized cupredoxin-like copper-binding protein
MSPRLLSALLCFLGLLVLRGTTPAQDETPIEMKTIAGLRFDPPRFAVKPGAKVKLQIENVDDMAHNFVLVTPGARMEVVNAAMTLPITPEQTFIPPSDSILHSTPVLVPGKGATLEFTAPATEGVYPYVCTYPGHGLVMYGAMYVTARSEAELPGLADDENLPDLVRDQAKTLKLHAYATEPPYWYRIFMRDSGPASIAVALPGGQNYCWDADECRLRYAWRGSFVDPQPHWQGNGDAFAEVKGTIYYRPKAFPLRFGDAKKVPTEVRFRGYTIVEKFPEFHYQIGSIEVRELIKPAHHGGLEATYKVSGTKSAVYVVIDPGAGVEATSPVGKFSAGVLKVPSDKIKEFTVALTEIPNKEAIGYWSMNDVLQETKPLPVDGINGRALIFDGKKSQFATGITTEAVAAGSTFAVWARLADPPVPVQVYIGAKQGDDEFALGANLGGVPGFGVRVKNAQQESKITAVMPMEADGYWHHLAASLDPVKGLRFYLDGKPAGMSIAAALPAEAEFFLGSSGKAHFAGATLDEARIYARVLDAKEIAALYEAERAEASPKMFVKTPPKPTATPAPKPSSKTSQKKPASSAKPAAPTTKPAATPKAAATSGAKTRVKTAP